MFADLRCKAMQVEPTTPSPSDSQVLYREVVKLVDLPRPLSDRAVKYSLGRLGVRTDRATARDYLRAFPDLMRHMAIFGAGRDMRRQVFAIHDFLKRFVGGN